MNTEKVSVNVNIVDLGKIDLLIKKGVYNNRTSFLSAAIMNELAKNESITERFIDKHQLDIGFIKYSKDYFESLQNQNIKININVLGRLSIADDVTLELLKNTVNNINVFGAFKASEEIKEYFKHD